MRDGRSRLAMGILVRLVLLSVVRQAVDGQELMNPRVRFTELRSLKAGFPTGRGISGSVAVWEEGWVTPGAHVQTRDYLRWTSPGHDLRSPAKGSPSKRCFPSRACYREIYSGFFWGRPRIVSEMLSCPEQQCVFSSQRLVHTAYEANPVARGSFEALAGLLAPAVPRGLQMARNASTPRFFPLRTPGPIRGSIWFKPLLWATAGWYSTFDARRNETTEPFLLEAKFPLTAANHCLGVFVFIPTTWT